MGSVLFVTFKVYVYLEWKKPTYVNEKPSTVCYKPLSVVLFFNLKK